jgi:hypothetical protein
MPSPQSSGSPAAPILSRRRAVALTAAGVVLAFGFLGWRRLTRFPPDTIPEGAYLRIVVNISEGRPRDCFAYLEDQAQHAAYSIRSFRQQASERIAESYPEPERSKLLETYRAHATAADGADVWLDMAQRKGWISRLRRDLSGIVKVELNGERASIETARGTRYGFRRRENGIWGLSIFTAELLAEAERAARDAEVVERAALDYARGK